MTALNADYKMVSPKLINLEEFPVKNAKQLPTFIKMVLPKLNNSEKPSIKDAEQLPTLNRMVLPDLLASNTIRTLKQYLKYN